MEWLYWNAWHHCTQWKAATGTNNVSFLWTTQTLPSQCRKQSAQYVWYIDNKSFFFVWDISHEKIKGVKRRHVCRSTAMLRCETLNLVSCGAPLPSSLSNFFSELLPWVYLRKAFKGSEFVLSIVLFQLGNVFQRQFHLKRFIDWIILLKGGLQKQKEPTVHDNLPASPFFQSSLLLKEATAG